MKNGKLIKKAFLYYNIPNQLEVFLLNQVNEAYKKNRTFIITSVEDVMFHGQHMKKVAVELYTKPASAPILSRIHN